MSSTVATHAGPPRSRSVGRLTPGGVPARLLGVATLGTVVVLGLSIAAPVASAAQPTVGLGTATSFAVLGSSTVTNTGPSVVSGDLGVYAGSAVTGFPPGTVNSGTQHVADALAGQAQNDATTAYNDAAGRTPVVTESADLGGQTLAPGVYQATSGLSLTGTVTLNAGGDPNAVFIFQAGSTLITASSSTVSLIGGADPCNVFWQVGSSATLGTTTTFVGTILALTSVSLQTGATVQGRVIARTGAVTLDSNTITRPTCATITAGTPTTTTTTPAGTTATSGAAAVTGASGSGGATGTGGTGATSSAASGSGVVPLGSPATGFGGAARPGHSATLAVVGAALLASGVGGALATRRRRARSAQDAVAGGAPGR